LLTKEKVIWVLCGVRAGDNAQALQLGRMLGGKIVIHKLDFNVLHHLPNWVTGPSSNHIKAAPRAALASPWPDIVIATGKRTARLAAWIRRQSHATSLAVVLGRPRMAFSYFDLIITTPQYGLPEAENVVRVALPFATRQAVGDDVLSHWRRQWATLPRPLIAAAIGAAKFPLRLGASQLEEYGAALNALARRAGGSILLFSSPRSASAATATVRSQFNVASWVQDGAELGNPYQAALWLADQFAVTGDSVSMMSEMLATGKDLHLYALPHWPSVHWRADHGVAAWLAQRGILLPPRDVSRFARELLNNGLAGDLRLGTVPWRHYELESSQADIVHRINLLQQRTSARSVRF
jgi:mitochondrial fission protein ELM1